MQLFKSLNRLYNRGAVILVQFAGLTFEQIIEKYSDTITKVCLVRLQNWADAEDCYQNTFLTLYQKSPDFNDENHLKAWLIRVAINECTDYIRSNKRTSSLEDAKNIVFSIDEDKSDLSFALLQLKPKYRNVIYLHYYEGYKIDEISQILGIKLNTVKSLLKRGKEKLKNIYGGEFYE